MHGNPIAINKPGMADLWGLVPTHNGLIHIEIEVKTGSSRQSKVQKTWQKFIESMGGHYFVVRDDLTEIEEILASLIKD